MSKKSSQIRSLLRSELDAGRLHTFEDVLRLVPNDLLARRLGKSVNQVEILLKKVDDLTFKEVQSLGSYCGLTPKELVEIVEASYFKQKIK